MPEMVAFTCARCGWTGLIRYVPATREDTGYLDGDPPEECPSGHDMTGVEGEDGSAEYEEQRAEAEIARAEWDLIS